ncbi:MAG: uracil permease [Firmicutes bacterium]|nr:uracil permease [Bacillota bacterium]
MEKNYVDVQERLPLLKSIPLSVQHLFAMFGATVLVPMLTGLDPAIALFTSGIGTLIFILVTKAQIPAYLGSSFAFIASIMYAVKTWGYEAALAGAFAAGLVYILVSLVIMWLGTGWIERLLSPVVVGSVIIVIGLGLAETALDMAGLLPGEGGEIINIFSSPEVWVSLFTLAVAIVVSIFFKGFLGVIPVLIGIVAGYVLSLALNLIDLTPVQEASWFALPNFTSPLGLLLNNPKAALPAMVLMAPVAIVTLAEHIGDILVLSNVVGRPYIKEPGLHRSILGDGIATAVASFFGGPPNTTYGENVGVLAITRVYSVWITGGAAVLAIMLGFVQKVGALIQTIPAPVMGGISILLFGIIASSGLRMLVQSGIDYSQKRNLVISSVILVLGIGGGAISIGSFALHGMPLATVIGVLLNLILPGEGGLAEIAADGDQSGEEEERG